MTVFIATIRTSFRRQLTYRAANLSGLATNLVFGFFRAAVFIALYQDQTSVNGFSVQDAITYAGLTQAIIGFLGFFRWFDLMDTINDGSVGSDLLKPINYFLYWLGIDIGRAMSTFLIRSLPLFVVFALFYDIVLPTTLLHWGAVMISLIFSLLVSFSWRFLVNLAAFWTPNAKGIGRFAFGLSFTFSGFFVPLAFFPDWLADVSRATPFAASVYIPIQVFLGNVQDGALFQSLMLQLFWVIALVILDQIILSFGLKKLVVQGG